jgi:hypothetical protein
LDWCKQNAPDAPFLRNVGGLARRAVRWAQEKMAREGTVSRTFGLAISQAASARYGDEEVAIWAGKPQNEPYFALFPTLRRAAQDVAFGRISSESTVAPEAPFEKVPNATRTIENVQCELYRLPTVSANTTWSCPTNATPLLQYIPSTAELVTGRSENKIFCGSVQHVGVGQLMQDSFRVVQDSFVMTGVRYFVPLLMMAVSIRSVKSTVMTSLNFKIRNAEINTRIMTQEEIAARSTRFAFLDRLDASTLKRPLKWKSAAVVGDASDSGWATAAVDTGISVIQLAGMCAAGPLLLFQAIGTKATQAAYSQLPFMGGLVHQDTYNIVRGDYALDAVIYCIVYSMLAGLTEGVTFRMGRPLSTVRYTLEVIVGLFASVFIGTALFTMAMG